MHRQLRSSVLSESRKDSLQLPMRGPIFNFHVISATKKIAFQWTAIHTWRVTWATVILVNLLRNPPHECIANKMAARMAGERESLLLYSPLNDLDDIRIDDCVLDLLGAPSTSETPISPTAELTSLVDGMNFGEDAQQRGVSDVESMTAVNVMPHAELPPRERLSRFDDNSQSLWTPDSRDSTLSTKTIKDSLRTRIQMKIHGHNIGFEESEAELLSKKNKETIDRVRSLQEVKIRNRKHAKVSRERFRKRAEELRQTHHRLSEAKNTLTSCIQTLVETQTNLEKIKDVISDSAMMRSDAWLSERGNVHTLDDDLLSSTLLDSCLSASHSSLDTIDPSPELSFPEVGLNL